MKFCKKCNKKIEKKSNNIFCSRSCSASFNNAKRPSRIKKEQISNCLNCKKIIIRKPSEIKRGLRIYCSLNCASTYKKANGENNRKKLFNLGKLKFRSHLRKFIIERDGYKCSCCDSTTWMGRPIPLWLDHIDGNASNNFAHNLRMICLNCDALSNTFGNKNKGRGRRSLGLKPWE